MPYTPRLHWPVYSPEATLPKTEYPVCPDPDGAYSESSIQRAVFSLDRVLRRWQRIYEFSQSSDCLLRVAASSSTKRIELPDASEVYPGDQTLEIHWWNEHVACLMANRRALASAKLLPSLIEHSLDLLAKYLATAEEVRNIRFIHANAVLPTHISDHELTDLAQQFGFWVVDPPRTHWERVHDFFEEYLVRALLWAFHRRKSGKKRRALRRIDLWASRADFLAAYERT